MSGEFINLSSTNLELEHLCCAISDKKHQEGVEIKKAWLKERIEEGHVFRKLNVKGKVFIEYAPLEKAWVPIEGENYTYIYCLWVSGQFKGKGYGQALLEYCIQNSKEKGRAGICILSAKKKKPFLADKKFLERYGFKTVDSVGEYELMALSFSGEKPCFAQSVKENCNVGEELTIYYSQQCPFIPHCIKEVEGYCRGNEIPLRLISVDSIEQAKKLPYLFNNWAVFYKGKFLNLQLLNEGQLKKVLSQQY